MDLISLLLLVGGIQGIFLGISLFNIKKGSRSANRILAIILWLFSFNILAHTLFHIGHSISFSQITWLERILQPLYYFYAIAFLFGPLVFFYCKALTQPNFQLTHWRLAHFLPALICLISFTPFYFDDKIYLVPSEHQTQLKEVHLMEEVIAWMVIFHLLFYLLASIQIIWKSNPQLRSKLSWLKILMVCFGFIWLSTLVIYLVGETPRTWDFFWLGASFFIYLVGYMAVTKPELVTAAYSSKYEKSSLTPELTRRTLQRLESVMKDEKPYFKADLSLPEMSGKLSLPVHHLSQIINEHFGMNFNDYINGYRIQEARKLIQDPSFKNRNLASIGYEVGFNSLSVFNTAFKKHTGLTPSRYRDNKID